jgi:RND family efflux transporter MFP subunit
MNEERRDARKPSRRRRLLVAIGLALVVSAAGLTGCTGRKSTQSGLTLGGAIEAAETDLGPGVSGRIRSVSVDEGDSVKKGQVVARLDDSELAALVQQAQGALATAEANLAQARAHTNKPEVAPVPGAAGTTRHTVDAARGQVQQAKGLLDQAKARLSQATVTAPDDGIVVGRLREVGEFVGPGTPIVRIANLDKVWLRVYAELPTLGKIKIGQPAQVTTDAYGSKKYSGTVAGISEEPEFTPKNVQTAEERVKLVYAIRIRLNNRSHELKPGMPAEAHLEFGQR